MLHTGKYTWGLLLLPAGLAGLVAAWYLLPAEGASLLRWDVLWYDSIRAAGYEFVPTRQNNAGFFPGFPYLWRALHLGPVGISVLNAALLLLTTALLAHQLQLRRAAVLLFVALPTGLFFYVPYSEALFCVASGGVLLGLARQRPALVVAALLLGGLVRPSALYFVPAALALGMLQTGAEPATYRRVLARTTLYVAAAGAGMAAVLLWQWLATGIWLAYWRAQLHWDHALKLVRLPFVSVSQGVLLLDGLALLCGAALAGWLLQAAWRRRPVAPELVFSAAFVAATVCNTLLHAPWQDGTTSLISMARYVFCTPFFLLLLHHFLPRQRPTAWQLVATLAAATGLAALLGFWQAGTLHFQSLLWLPLPRWLAAVGLPVYAVLWLFAHYRLVRFALYGIGLALQLLLLRNFLLGFWAG